MFQILNRLSNELADDASLLRALSVAWCVAATAVVGYGTFAIVLAWRRRRATRDLTRPRRHGRNVARALMLSVRRSSEIWFFVPAIPAAIAVVVLACAVALVPGPTRDGLWLPAALGSLLLGTCTFLGVTPLTTVVSLVVAWRARSDADAAKGIRPLIASAGMLVAFQMPVSAAWACRLIPD